MSKLGEKNIKLGDLIMNRKDLRQMIREELIEATSMENSIKRAYGDIATAVGGVGFIAHSYADLKDKDRRAKAESILKKLQAAYEEMSKNFREEINSKHSTNGRKNGY